MLGSYLILREERGEQGLIVAALNAISDGVAINYLGNLESARPFTLES